MVRVLIFTALLLAVLPRLGAAQSAPAYAPRPAIARPVRPQPAGSDVGSRLRQNPLPLAYRGPAPTVATPAPSPVMRVWLRAVDADGRPQAGVQVRATGSAQALWTDESGRLSLLVDITPGPLHLVASAFGYNDAELTIARPEDNNLVFQLFRTKTPAAP